MSAPYSRRRLSSAVLVLAASALFVTGCGDVTETESTTSSTVSSSASSSASSPEVAAGGEIVVAGLVDYPMTLTVLDMDYMDWVTVTADHPEAGPTEYDGILLVDIFSYVGVQPDATTVVLTASDGASAEIPLDDISSDEAILAVNEDDVMSAVLPGMDGENWVEDIVSMEFE